MDLIIGLIVLIFSAILHEVAHGYVADRFGDPTARLAGRLTLDPRPHIDPFMSVLLPLLLIISGSPIVVGGAKPVPVDPFNLKEGRKDMALVALVGPLTNVLLAVAGAMLYRFLDAIPIVFPAIVGLILVQIVRFNLLLAIFNLIPIPPLDGSKVFAMLLPEDSANRYLTLSQFGMIILFFLLLFPVAGFSLMHAISTLLNFSFSLLLP